MPLAVEEFSKPVVATVELPFRPAEEVLPCKGDSLSVNDRALLVKFVLGRAVQATEPVVRVGVVDEPRELNELDGIEVLRILVIDGPVVWFCPTKGELPGGVTMEILEPIVIEDAGWIDEMEGEALENAPLLPVAGVVPLGPVDAPSEDLDEFIEVVLVMLDGNILVSDEELTPCEEVLSVEVEAVPTSVVSKPVLGAAGSYVEELCSNDEVVGRGYPLLELVPKASVAEVSDKLEGFLLADTDAVAREDEDSVLVIGP